jgi:hypothetical protein
MVGAYALRTHFESGIGVGIAGAVPEGDVTLLRIGGAGMERLWVADGRSLPHTPLEDVCRTQMDVELSDPAAAAELLDRPLGNHIVAVYGHHADRLRSWWRAMVAPAEKSDQAPFGGRYVGTRWPQMVLALSVQSGVAQHRGPGPAPQEAEHFRALDGSPRMRAQRPYPVGVSRGRLIIGGFRGREDPWLPPGRARGRR